MCFRSTLLPEPLGPMSTKISPGSTVNVTSLSTVSAPKFLLSFSIDTPTAGLSTWVNGLRVGLQEEGAMVTSGLG